MICQINGTLTFFVYYFNCFFLRLIITCRLWVIYVREDNYSNVEVMIKLLIWTIWTLMSSVLKKADKLNLSLSLVACSVLSHYLSQCRVIFDWTCWNKLNAIWIKNFCSRKCIWKCFYKMWVILFRPHCVNSSRLNEVFMCNLAIIGSDKGLLPFQSKVITWTSAGL